MCNIDLKTLKVLCDELIAKTSDGLKNGTKNFEKKFWRAGKIAKQFCVNRHQDFAQRKL